MAGAGAPARSRKTSSPPCPTTTGPCWCRTWTSGTRTCLRRHRWFGWRARRPVRRVPAAGPWPSPLADRRQRIDQGQAATAGLSPGRGTEAAEGVQADPRLGAGAGRHAVPATERAAPRRG
ncbi:hypothetical protein G6F57_019686 [Rhizopus arrhizus]|nr:hypothetical protein G6F57_019686 [Rhizopus arrhizus]